MLRDGVAAGLAHGEQTGSAIVAQAGQNDAQRLAAVGGGGRLEVSRDGRMIFSTNITARIASLNLEGDGIKLILPAGLAPGAMIHTLRQVKHASQNGRPVKVLDRYAISLLSTGGEPERLEIDLKT